MALASATLASMWFRGLRLESHRQRADQRFLGGDLFSEPEVVKVRPPDRLVLSTPGLPTLVTDSGCIDGNLWARSW
ncbi:hypothetical protein LQ51_21375 [Micromonospora sp. HK10]|nr:hypothetical protein LQ51_21375 [Micromonospora sp. HK10]